MLVDGMAISGGGAMVSVLACGRKAWLEACKKKCTEWMAQLTRLMLLMLLMLLLLMKPRRDDDSECKAATCVDCV